MRQELRNDLYTIYLHFNDVKAEKKEKKINVKKQQTGTFWRFLFCYYLGHTQKEEEHVFFSRQERRKQRKLNYYVCTIRIQLDLCVTTMKKKRQLTLNVDCPVDPIAQNIPTSQYIQLVASLCFKENEKRRLFQKTQESKLSQLASQLIYKTSRGSTIE